MESLACALRLRAREIERGIRANMDLTTEGTRQTGALRGSNRGNLKGVFGSALQ